MTTPDTTDWNERNRDVIAAFRKAEGRLEGMELVLITTTGAKSGRPPTTPLMYLAEGDEIYVIASKGGAPANPAWYHNLVAHPTVTVELGGDTYEATASVLTGTERDRTYGEQSRRYPFFAAYQKATARQIPVVRLERMLQAR